MPRRYEAEQNLPAVAERQLKWFTAYTRFYLRRNFHGLHLLRLIDLEQLNGLPLLVCMNHPSWWDPLVGLYLSQRFFAKRNNRSPIAADGLAKYRLFERFGFFGIDQTTRAGAVRFLRLGSATLSDPTGALWITPQGAFTDIRQRPVKVEPGIGHLAHRLGNLAMLPLAVEYSFWNERYPEAFACFGKAVVVASGKAQTADEWNTIFSSALEETQNALAEVIQRRDASLFEPLLSGNAGVGGVYDIWRACKARLQGKPWQPEHGSH